MRRIALGRLVLFVATSVALWRAFALNGWQVGAVTLAVIVVSPYASDRPR